jgi:transposase
MSHWNSAKYVWNACVERHKKHQPWLTCKDLTHMRATLTNTEGKHWLRESSVIVQQQAIRDFRQAKSKSRNFKSAKTSLPSMNYTRNAFSLKDDPVTGKRVLILAGGARIPVVWSRELPSVPSSARVYRDSLGHWYASFVVEIDKQVELSPEALWEQYGNQGIIEKDRFFSYYEGRETGVGILVKQVFRCEQPRSLSDIGVKTPPQNFQYLSEEALQALA